MAELIKTLNKKDDPNTLVYPNIKPENIPAAAISTQKLEDGVVTESKIYDASVTGNKIAYKTIQANNIDDNAITNAKVVNSTIEPIKLKVRVIMHLGTLKVTHEGTDYYFPYALMEATDNPLNEITDFTSFKEVWMYLYDDFSVPFSKGTTAQFGVSNLYIYLPDNTVIIANENNVEFEDTFSHTIY